MNEYELMCKDSPVQKEWTPKGTDLVLEEVMDFDIISYNEDNTATVELKGKKNVLKNCPMTQYHEKWEFHKYFTWLPRQEDWQEIYRKHTNSDVTGTAERQFELEFDLLSYWLNDRTIIGTRKKEEVNSWAEAWCLFVNYEVYGLTWDWEEKKWVKG